MTHFVVNLTVSDEVNSKTTHFTATLTVILPFISLHYSYNITTIYIIVLDTDCSFYDIRKDKTNDCGLVIYRYIGNISVILVIYR